MSLGALKEEWGSEKGKADKLIQSMLLASYLCGMTAVLSHWGLMIDCIEYFSE